jgi:hypothetical protein
MADKRISQLIERTDIANNDVLPIVASGATTTNKVTISTIQDWMQDNLDVGVTSVGLSVPSAFSVSGSPVTTSGNITISGAGTTAQYIRGDGSLADFPSISGGGSSVSYYLNGSVSQGTIGGVAYRELSKVPILGAGTDFTINADGYIASFITDAGDPSLLEIPGGNWNFETYFQASSGGGSPTFYVELYKVSSGGTATLIATSSGSPELIAFGTNITPYFSSLAVPTTTLALTDRLAIRYYVVHAGRTITLHTENNTLCQIITTFTTGLTALNGLTAQVQNFATGTSGTDFNISSASTTHTFNLPDASASNRGAVTTGTQTFAGYKIFNGTIGANVDIQLATQGTALNTFIKNINATGQTSIGSNGFGFNNANNIYFSGSSKGGGIIAFSNTGNQTYTLQNASGTLAFTSDLGAYLPLTGGTLTGALGGTSLNFSGDIQTATRLISATGGQQILINANNGGSTNRIESVGTLPLALVSAAAITMAAGGTTPQITLTTAGNVAIGTGSVTGAINTDSFRSNLILGAANSNKISFNNGSSTQTGYVYNDSSETSIGYPSSGSFAVQRVGVGSVFTLASTGAANFSSSVTAASVITSDSATAAALPATSGSTQSGGHRLRLTTNGASTAVIDYGTAGGNGGWIQAAIKDSLGTTLPLLLNPNGGNVGIGTASPTAKIHAVDNANGFVARFTGGASSNVLGGFYAHSSLGFASIGVQSAHDFRIFTNDIDRVSVTSTGNVGIGTASPGGLLHSLKSGTPITGVGDEVFIGQNSSGASNSAVTIVSNNEAILRMTNTTNVELGKILYNTTSNFMRFDTNTTERMRITSGGAVQIGTRSDATESTANLTLNNTNYGAFHWLDGTAYYIGQNSNFRSVRIYSGSSSGTGVNLAAGATSWGTYSDERLKENIENIDSVLPKLSNLRTVKYHLKNIDTEDSKKRLGLIAQDLVGNFDEVLSESRYSDEDETEYYDVRYTELIPVLIKAIQEQQEQIDSLKNQIK